MGGSEKKGRWGRRPNGGFRPQMGGPENLEDIMPVILVVEISYPVGEVERSHDLTDHVSKTFLFC